MPLAAFVGGLLAVGISYGAGHISGRSPVTLILAGVAVASFLTACQTYVLQRNTDLIREVYTWILGRVATSGWTEPAMLAPYFVVTVVVLLRYARPLDVLAVGDEEAMSLGVDPERVRLIVVIAASLGGRRRRRDGAHRVRRHHRAPHGPSRLRRREPGGAAALAAVRRGVHGRCRPGRPDRPVCGGAPDRCGDRVRGRAVLRAGSSDESPGGVVTALVLDRVGVDLGGAQVLDGVSLTVEDHEWLNIVGPNGAGKTTLLRAVLGAIGFSGAVGLGATEARDRRARARVVAYVPQNPTVPPGVPVIDYVLWVGPAPGDVRRPPATIWMSCTT
ncbi:MAG: iron chelate uptake ABC transporter family permease subunit [Acidimicrobiales bacterium]